MEAFDKMTEMSFHGITYIVRVSAKETSLYVEIEEKETGDIWKSSFPANYIEEITQKTGNFKKFDVFVKMLQSAISKASESVFIDILSAHDLEMMKAKNQKQTVNKPVNVPKNAKRYIILTYSVEYDKVHYPLPLNYEETPNVPALKNTIKQLRAEVERLKALLNKAANQNNDGFFMTAMGDTGNAPEVQALRAENEALKERLKKIDDLGGTGGTQKKLGAVELDLLMKSKHDLEAELENLKKDYVRDIKRMKTKLEEVDTDRKNIFEELTKLKNQAAEQEMNDGTRRVSNAPKEDSDSFLKKLILKHQKEAEKYRHEVESFRILDNKQKARIKQLEMDLQAVNRGAGGRNKGASPTLPRQKDLSLRNSDKRSTSVTKSLSPSFKLTGTGNPQNRVSAKPMPTKSMGSGLTGGNVRNRNQISPLARSPPMDRRVSPPRSNLNEPYPNKRSPHISPLNKHYLSPLNSKVSPSNKLGGLGYNNYLVNSPNAYGSGSKSGNLKLSGNLDSVKQSLMIMGAGSGPVSSKGDAPGNLSIVSQSNIKHNLQEHYLELSELKGNKTVEHTPADPLLNSEDVVNKKLNKLQDLFKNVKS